MYRLTCLESRYDVALYCVAIALGDIVHAEIANERVQCHRAADDGRIIAHY